MADFERNSRFSKVGKIIDISTLAGEKSRVVFMKSKEKAKHSINVDENTPEQYASSQIQDFMQEVADDSAYIFNRAGKKATKKTVKNMQNIKAKKAAIDMEKAKKCTSAPQSMADVHLSVENIKYSDTHSTPYVFKRERVKSFNNNFTSMQKTNKVVNKKSIHNYQVSKAAKKSQKTAQATKKTVQKSRDFIRKTAKATKKALKAIIDSAKALVNAIIAGGWITVVIIILICLVAAVASSVYGIFFSSEDNGNGLTINSVIQEINNDYNSKIAGIKSSSDYDTCEINGSQANWKDILAIYTVKTATDSTTPQQVAIIDDNTKNLLSSVFWDMNTITSSVNTRTETKETEITDEEGKKVVVTEQIEIKVLNINISSHTALEMAEQYNFTDKQKEYLLELTDDKNNDLWNALIFGLNLSGSNIDIGSLTFENETVNDTQKKIVAVATNSTQYGISAGSGYCQAWVADVYQAVTGKRGSAHCALCAADMWAVSTDWKDIQVGATVYGYASNPYGHVGIYIGNGKVIHNLMGIVKVQSLESWVKDFKGFAWGWENNIALNS